MRISHPLLDKAVDAHILTKKQAAELWAFFKSQPEQNAIFNLTNTLYYLGGLVAIGAMSIFMTLAWTSFGGWGIFFIALLYGLVGLFLSARFKYKNLPIPAGICATFVVCLTPLAIYGLQVGMGWWPDDVAYRDYHRLIRWYWIYMELGTLVVGAILAWIYRYPFMLMPIAVTLWYMSMDLAAMIAGNNASFTLSTQVSLYFGLFMILLAFYVDLRSRLSADYAFWLYLFGVMTFWGGLSMQYSDSEVAKFIYMCINLLMIGVGVTLVRKVFVVFGALGCCFYLGYLASQVFKDSVLFPIALTVIGFLIIYLGILWQKNEPMLTKKAQSFLPKSIQALLQSRQDE